MNVTESRMLSECVKSEFSAVLVNNYTEIFIRVAYNIKPIRIFLLTFTNDRQADAYLFSTFFVPCTLSHILCCFHFSVRPSPYKVMLLS